MRINVTNYQQIKIGEEIIETVSSFCYRNSVITNNGESAENIRYRINKESCVFCSPEKILRSIHIWRNTTDTCSGPTRLPTLLTIIDGGHIF